MSALTVARHNTFGTYAFDLGIHSQALAHPRAPRLPLVTLYGPEPVNQFGDHFAPIFYLLTPLSRAVRRPASCWSCRPWPLAVGGCAGLPAGPAQAGPQALALALAASLSALPGPARRQHLRLPRDRSGRAAAAVEPLFPGDGPLSPVRPLPGPGTVHQGGGGADRRRHRSLHPVRPAPAPPRRAGYGAGLGALLRVGGRSDHACVGRRRRRGALR